MERELEDRLGRPVHVTSISGLGGRQLSLHGLRIGDSEPGWVAGRVQRVDLEFERLPILGGGEAPQSVVIVDANLLLRYGDHPALPFKGLEGELHREGGTYTIDRFEGRLFEGDVSLFGEVRPGDESERYAVQGHLAGVDLGPLGRAYRRPGISGRLHAFVDLDERNGGPQGAGWFRLRRSQVWRLPLLAGVLETLDLAAGESDYLRHAEAQFLLDQGRFHFSELTAIGSPVSLYGKGSMNLDGSELRSAFVPRMGRGLLSDLPVVGQPGQLVLDVAKGIAVELRLRGSWDDIQVSAMPLPVLTGPIEAFFELVVGD